MSRAIPRILDNAFSRLKCIINFLWMSTNTVQQENILWSILVVVILRYLSLRLQNRPVPLALLEGMKEGANRNILSIRLFYCILLLCYVYSLLSKKLSILFF